MPNTSSPSLAAEPFGEEFVQEELKKQQDIAGNLNVDGFVDQIIQDEIGRVSAAARWAKQFDPESYAKAQKLAPGLPPDVASRQLPTLEQIDKVNAYNAVFEKDSNIRRHFARFPKDLPSAHPDELDNISGINWVLSAATESFQAGQTQAEMTMLGQKFVAGTATESEMRTLQAFVANRSSRTFGAEGWFEEALTFTGQMAPMAAQSVLGGVGGAAGGASLGAALGQLGGPAGAVLGTSLGAGVGGLFGSMTENIKLGQGEIAMELLSFRDEAGNPLDPNIVRWAAFLGGTGSGLLEQLGLSKTLGLVPGLDKIFTGAGVKTMLKNPMMREAFTRFTKSLGEAVTVETLTEMGQEGMNILAGELAKTTSEQDFQMLTSEEAAQRVLDAGVQALQVMTLLGPVTAGTRFAADLHTMRQSKRANDNLRKIGLSLEDNGFVERAPAVATQLIDTVSGGQKLYIPAEEMRTLYQEQGLDVYGPALPNWRTRFDEALATGSDVEVSMGEFFTALGTDPANNPMYTLVRADPSHYIPAEMTEFSEGMDELLGSELQRAEGRIGRKLDDKVKKAVAEQVSQLGFTPEATNFYSTLLGSYFNAQAARLGIDPLTLFQQNLELAREDLSQTIENGNSMVPSLRRLFQSAWHGSRAIFDQFSTDFMGTGEGAQAFGWGLYFAQAKDLATSYRKKLSRNQRQLIVGDKKVEALEGVKSFLAGRPGSTETMIDRLDRGIAEVEDSLALSDVLLNAFRAQTPEERARSIGRSISLEEYEAKTVVEKQRDMEMIASFQAIKALVEEGQKVQVISGPVLRVKRGGEEVRTEASGRAVKEIVSQIDGLAPEESEAIETGLNYVLGGATIEEAQATVKETLDLLYPQARVDHILGILSALEPTVEQAGRLYEVNLPDDDQLLLWDVPLSEQDPKVQAALAKLGFSEGMVSGAGLRRINPATGKEISLRQIENIVSRRLVKENGISDDQAVLFASRADGAAADAPARDGGWLKQWNEEVTGTPWDETDQILWEKAIAIWKEFTVPLTGEEIYQQLKEQKSSEALPRAFDDDEKFARVDRLASLALHDVGILGHKFLDGNSRSSGQGTYNFVIYSDEAIEIKRFEQREPSLRPALRVDGKILRGEVGEQHSGFMDRLGIASDVDADYGFINHKGQFLDREKAFEYARENDLVASRYTRLLSGGLAGDFLKTYDPEKSADLKLAAEEGRLDPRTLAQGELEKPRGAITFQPDKPALIQLFAQADMSTLLHESVHFFLETTKEWAKLSPEIDAQWQMIKKHLKIGEDNEITREQHEQFARWGEAYFFDGKAPNAELRSAFAAFRQWLKAIYKSIRNLGGAVHPEIRSVFDSMLTSDDRFDAVSNDTAYAPMFRDAAEMGVDPADYLEYQRWVQTWRDEAQDQTISRVIGQQKRLISGHYKKIRAELIANNAKHLATLPPYSHLPKFKTPGFAMDTEAFSKLKRGPEAAKAFPRAAFNKAGLDPEVVAELLGYPTADDMVYDFLSAPPIKQAATELADAEMIRRYGEDFNDQAILDLAVKRALAEEARTTILAKEYQVLSRKAGREVSQTAPRQLAQEIARRTVRRKKVKDVNERQAQAGARRAGVMAETAMRKGDWVAAADWKRKQLLAQAIDNETQVLNRSLLKIRDKAAKYSKTAPKSIDPGAMEQIRALVSQYHFAKVPLKQLAKTQKLREWLDEQQRQGLVPQVPEHLLRRAEKLNWKELSVDELLGLGDALDNLEHMGQLKQKLRTSKGLRDFAAAKGEIIRRIEEAMKLNPRKPKKMKTYSEEEQSARDYLADFHAVFMKPEAVIEFLDAERIGGPLATYVFEPIARAQTLKNDINLQYNSKLMDILQKFENNRLLEMVEIKSLLGARPREEALMTRENLIVVALNTGNSSNREKLLQGELWTEVQLAEMLSYLSKEDWDRVQEIWNLLNELWEKESAMERRLKGVAPPKIEAREFTNQHGTYSGGYYPVVYDFKARRGLGLIQDITPQDKRGDLESDLFPKNFTPGTNHKHLVAREKVAKPFRLDLHVLPGHLHNVIHDLAYREAIRSAYKVLWDPDISNKITDAEGEFAVRELRQWLRGVATEHAYENDPTLNLFTKLRVGATMVAMGFRVSTALSQFLGILPALTRVSARQMASGLWQMTRDYQGTIETVHTLSGELRHRFNNQDREIRETVRALVTKPTALDKIRAAAFVHIGVMDQFVSTATWLAAYQQQMEIDPTDQDLAIQAGDRTVRLTQGTGTVKDFAGIMNRGGWWRLFTMYYSYFSAQYGMQVRLTRQTKRVIREEKWEDLFLKRLPDWSKLVVIPAILGALLTGQGPEDDEDPALWAVRKTLLYPLAAIPLLRDVVGAAQGYPFRLSPVAKAGEEFGRALYNLIPDERREYHPEKAIEPGLAAASIFLRLPVDQLMTSTEALWKGVANDDLTLGDLLYGRREE